MLIRFVRNNRNERKKKKPKTSNGYQVIQYSSLFWKIIHVFLSISGSPIDDWIYNISKGQAMRRMQILVIFMSKEKPYHLLKKDQHKYIFLLFNFGLDSQSTIYLTCQTKLI